MKKIILIFGILLFIYSCDKNEEEIKYPSCFQATIDNYLKNFNPSPTRASIKKYKYNGKEVYLIDFFYQVPDASASVNTSDCEIICGFGGITGGNTCESWESAEFIETVWVDPR